tara:strand:+ start:841 stop:1263 length:423 start_codon:yes stop_codon:yes gene_type:complete
MLVIDKTNWSTSEEVVGDLSKEIESTEGNYVLLNYLRTPVGVETSLELGNLKISDLIRQWKNNSSLKSYLTKETENTFGKTYGSCYSLVSEEEVIFGEKNSGNFECVDFPIDSSQLSEICINLGEYHVKLEEGETEKCFS